MSKDNNKKDFMEDFANAIGQIGEHIGNAMEQVGEQIEKAMEQVEDAMEKIGTEIEDTMDEVGGDFDSSFDFGDIQIGCDDSLELELIPLKGSLPAELELFNGERYIIKLLSNASIIPVKEKDKEEYLGAVLLGDFDLNADTIFNTENGAVGKSIHRQANGALFLTSTFDFPEDMTPIEETDADYIQAQLIVDKFLGVDSKSKKKFNPKGEEEYLVYFFPQEEKPNFWLITAKDVLIILEGKEIYVLKNDKNYVEVSGSNKSVIVYTPSKKVEISPGSGIVIDCGSGSFSLHEFMKSLGKNLSKSFSKASRKQETGDYEPFDEEEDE